MVDEFGEQENGQRWRKMLTCLYDLQPLRAKINPLLLTRFFSCSPRSKGKLCGCAWPWCSMPQSPPGTGSRGQVSPSQLQSPEKTSKAGEDHYG